MDDYRTMFSLESKTAVVVGAASGIGRACSAGLVDFGARVVCADIDQQGVERTAKEMEARGGEAVAATVDMTDPDDIAGLLDLVDRPDVLVSTPSINIRRPLCDTDDEDFDQVVGLNLKGSFRLMREFGRAMAAQGSGSIIVFSSIRATVVEPGQGVYAATKAGIVQMLRALAAELGPRGVRANAIAPGVVETPLTAQIKQDAGWYDAYRQKSVLERWATPDDLVGAVLYLASDASAYVTGSCLMVDGGWTAADGRFAPPL